MIKKILYFNIPGQYSVEMRQELAGDESMARFAVFYGQDVRRDLPWNEAAAQFGQCCMHAATCAGLIEWESVEVQS